VRGRATEPLSLRLEEAIGRGEVSGISDTLFSDSSRRSVKRVFKEDVSVVELLAEARAVFAAE